MGARKIEAYDIQESEEKSLGKKESKEVFEADSKIADVFEIEKSIHAKGNLVFNKPAHYDEDEKHTRISVVDKVGEKEITRNELESYITQNKKINKIVIEEVKANDVKRTNLIFDERKKRKKLNGNIKVDASRVECELNQEFLSNPYFNKGNSLKNEFEEAVALLGKNKDESKKSKKAKIEVVDEVDFKTKPKKDIYEDISFSTNIDREEPIKNIKEDQDKDNYIFSNLSLDSEEESTVTEVEINRHEFKRKNNKSLSKLYYKVKNHIELFKLGDSYLRDFNRGIKSLAFNSTGIKGERERTVLGVTSFLNYNAKVTVTVVTDDLQKTLYHNFITDLEEIKKPILNEDVSFSCYATQGVEFVEFSEICDVMYQLGNTSFEDFVESFVESSDVVLWDLPELKDMDNKKEVFYPVIRSLESVSLIVKANHSKYAELHKVKDYFEKYKVPFKGLVLAD